MPIAAALLAWTLVSVLAAPAAAREVLALTPGFQTATGQVFRYAVTPDHTRAVYIADEDIDGERGLYSVMLANPGVSTRLDKPAHAAADVISFVISPDGTRVAFVGDQDTDGIEELYSVPIDGAAPARRLNPAFVPGACAGFACRVAEYRFTPDSARVIYRANQDGAASDALYVAAVDGAQQPSKLSGTMTSGGGVIPNFVVGPDGSRVFFRANKDALDKIELYSVPAAEGSEPVKLNGTLVAGGSTADGNLVNPDVGFQVSPDGATVVYRADQDIDEVFELYVVAADGSGAATRLTPTPPAGGDVLAELTYQYGDGFRFSADGRRVVYRADHAINDVIELYSVPVDGSAAPVRINGPLVNRGDVSRFALSPDGTSVVYRADQDVDNREEFYLAAVDGSRTPTKLNGPLPAGGSVSIAGFRFTPDGSRLVYGANGNERDRYDLFSVGTAGGAPVTLNGALQPGGYVHASFALSADGTRVIYRTNDDGGSPHELYSAPVDGTSAAVKLNGGFGDAAWGVDSFSSASLTGHVVYLADQRSPGVPELFVAALDAAGGDTRLSGDLVTGGSVSTEILITPDGRRAVYLADEIVDGLDEVFSVPLDASAASLRISAPLPRTGKIFSTVSISPDGTRVVYRARSDADAPVNLFSAPTAGGTVAQLNPPLPQGGIVQGFEIAPDSSRVLYGAAQDSPHVEELYAAPIDGSSSAYKLNQVLGTGGDVFSGTPITPDSSRALFLARVDGTSPRELFSVPIAGGGTPLRLNAPLPAGGNIGFVAIAPDGFTVIYSGDQDVVGVNEIYRVPIDGSAPPLKLNAALVAGGQAGSLAVAASPGGQRLVYLADQDIDGVTELYSVRFSGGAAVKLSATLVENGDVETFAPTPDGTRVVYLADQDTWDRTELYSVPIDGAQAAVKLNVASGDNEVLGFALTPDSARVVYLLGRQLNQQSAIAGAYSVPVAGGVPVLLTRPPPGAGPLTGIAQLAITADGSRLVYVANYGDGADALYSVPITGGVAPVHLNAPVVSGGRVDKFVLTPDGARAVYRADQDIVGDFRLFHVAVDQDGDAIVDGSDPDIDGDGLDNQLEHVLGTHTYLFDTDDDGLSDLQEVAMDGDPSDYTAGIDTDPNNPDTDGDGLVDGVDPSPLLEAGPAIPVPLPVWMLPALVIALLAVTVRCCGSRARDARCLAGVRIRAGIPGCNARDP